MIIRASGLAAIALAMMSMTACDKLQANREAAEQDRPNLVAGDEKSDRDVINSTPQASLSAEEREQLRALAASYLDSVAENEAEGFTKVAGTEDEITTLQPTQTHEYSVSLAQGTVYRIIGACDNECSDFDLELLDPSGRVVESDTLPDDVPIINITPRAAGNYKVRMTMKTCTIAPCYAGARLMQRG